MYQAALGVDTVEKVLEYHLKPKSGFSILKDNLETKYDMAHVDDRISEISKQMTAGQLTWAN